MASSLMVDFLGHWLLGSRKIQFRQAKLSIRQQSALACFELCIEHSFSVLMLLKYGCDRQVSSALALLRPSLEACLRGGWIHSCNDDVAYAAYLTEPYKKLPKKWEIVQDLEKVMEPKNYEFLKHHASEVDGFYNDFTHGGNQQILRRFNPDGSLRYRATKDEERFVVANIVKTHYIASQWYADLLGDHEAKKKLSSLFASLEAQKYLDTDMNEKTL